ncbi:ABC1 kinase family protein [Nocardia thailandica]|uniref:ABC1 kinase family protein n=1 Tax=Nocardia thailandica TaxID=257275 RepID=UPI0006950A0F|nr:AarF/ABC1/UbiB kinase family protein [Nocardia thailandica]
MARGARLGRLAAGQAARGLGTRVAMVGRTEQARARLATRASMQTAQQIVTVLGGMKGAAMKLGQMASVLDLDLIPEDSREMFRVKLAELCDSAPEVTFAQMRAVIEADLGPLARAFADFDERPVAAASIGQVYRARLHDGRMVAVKVKYPGVDRAVHADLRNLRFFRNLLGAFLPSAGDVDVLDEISTNIAAELDYRREARSQHRVASRYRDHPFILVPDTIAALCTDNVLVTEFVEGLPFHQTRHLAEAERDRVGELVYRFYITGMFRDGEYCADPHPGNIILAEDGRVGFVDFGLYSTIAPEARELERRVLRAAAEERPDEIEALWRGRGIITEDSAITGEDCLDYVWSASGWHLFDEELTVTPAIATSAVVLATDPRAPDHRAVRRLILPPEHVFSRRAELFTLTCLGRIGASGNWHRLAREWLYDEAPATEIGRGADGWSPGARPR